MKKVALALTLGAIMALPAVSAFADEATSTPMMGGGYSMCVPVSSSNYPSGWYCPTEGARQRMIDILKAEIAQLEAELASLGVK